MRYRIAGFVHGAVFVLVCCLLLMAPKCGDDGGNAGGNQTKNDNAATRLGYCAQSDLDAFPLGTVYVKGKFNAAKNTLGLKIGSQTLALEPVLATNQGWFEYWRDNCFRDNNGNPVCQFQLFAIKSFKNAQNVEIDTLGGVCYWGNPIFYGSISVFIPVVTLQSKFAKVSPDDRNKGISKSTIHELGHLVGNLKDCWDDPAGHVARECVMTDTAVEQVGANWILRNVCGTDVLVFKDDFCNYCSETIGNAKIVPAP